MGDQLAFQIRTLNHLQRGLYPKREMKEGKKERGPAQTDPWVRSHFCQECQRGETTPTKLNTMQLCQQCGGWFCTVECFPTHRGNCSATQCETCNTIVPLTKQCPACGIFLCFDEVRMSDDGCFDGHVYGTDTYKGCWERRWRALAQVGRSIPGNPEQAEGT